MSPQINGRLLRPEEGCGITDAPTVFRIIGGSEAEIGKRYWDFSNLMLSSKKIVLNF